MSIFSNAVKPFKCNCNKISISNGFKTVYVSFVSPFVFIACLIVIPICLKLILGDKSILTIPDACLLLISISPIETHRQYGTFVFSSIGQTS